MRPPRFNKFGAKRAHCSIGHEHASKKEAKRCNELRVMERAGELSHLEFEPQFYFSINGAQVKHDNGRRVGYKADFSYRLPNGKQIVEDSKGFVVRDWPLRKAIFKHLFPEVELRIV